MSKFLKASKVWSALLAVVVMSFVLIPDASASKSKVTVATGAVSCSTVTGSITYNPPVHHVGTTAETQIFTFVASHCTTSQSNVKHVVSGTVTVAIHRPSNSCISLLSTHLSSSTGTWRPSSIHSTTASFSGYDFVYSAVGDVGFTAPNPGGTARVTGSFAGKDHGARSSVTAYTNMTPSHFEAGCLSPSGISRQTIVSGSARFS